MCRWKRCTGWRGFGGIVLIFLSFSFQATFVLNDLVNRTVRGLAGLSSR